MGLVDLLEALLGAFLLVDVGMRFARQPPECLPDRLLVGAPVDAQDLVVVLELHYWATLTLAGRSTSSPIM